MLSFYKIVSRVIIWSPLTLERRQDSEEVDGGRWRFPERGVAGAGRLWSSGEAAGTVHGDQTYAPLWQQRDEIQLNDCEIDLCPTTPDQALVNDIHTIQPSVNGINEVGLYLKEEAEPLFAVYIQKLLDELNGQWENVCKQVRVSAKNIRNCAVEVSMLGGGGDFAA